MAVDILVSPSDRGGFFYRELRVSRGKTFGLLKFRSLRADVVRRTAAYAFAHPLGSTRIQITPSDKRDTVRGGAALFAYERARRAGSR